MIKFPQTVEKLVNTYDDYIKDWIRYNNSGNVDADEFVSSFYEKIITKKSLEKFNPDKGFKFETWLNTVLRNHYNDQINKQLKENWISIDSMNEKNDNSIGENKLPSEEIDHLDEIIKEETLVQLITLINNIENARDRVLIKLKYYQKGQSQLISFEEKDLSYLEKHSSLSKQEIIDYIDDNVKKTYGVKDKDICMLLNIAEGSVGTFFQRAVRKWLKA